MTRAWSKASAVTLGKGERVIVQERDGSETHMSAGSPQFETAIRDLGRDMLVRRGSNPDPRAAALEDPMLGWSVPANLRWLAEQSERPGYTPCGALTGSFLQGAAGTIERLAIRVVLAEKLQAEAERERDSLLAYVLPVGGGE